MRIIVQVPAYNEEVSVGRVVSNIPRKIPGTSSVEVLVIDDGSLDNTALEAKLSGADYVISHSGNRGLARAFETGINFALKKQADVVVNIDADMQYNPADIPLLVGEIVSGRADIAIADRQVWKSRSFGIIKRVTQVFGSAVVSSLANQSVNDAVSGFRAYSRDAALDLNILSDFSYTTESIIQASALRRRIISIPVTRLEDVRPSRLAKSSFQFVVRQAKTIIRARIMYRPLHTFSAIGGILALVGVLPILRFLYYFIIGRSDGYIQSLILGVGFLIISFLVFSLGIIADLIGFNRKLVERNLRLTKERYFSETGNWE